MKILISAYACEPEKGSEPGAGWNWASAAAKRHEVWVLTRKNNRAAIDRALASAPSDFENIQFVYLDLPGWAQFWKSGRRGLRTYYVLWQFAAARTGRRLHGEHKFDVVHHLTFANVWLPALVSLVRAPFVLGPVGGGPSVPIRLYPSLGIRGSAKEVGLAFARKLSRFNPLVQTSLSRATLIICQNAETRASLPRRYRQRTVLQTNASVPAGLEPAVATLKPRAERQAIYAGRLTAWKGLSLAVEAVAATSTWRLIVVGEGSDRARVERLARRLGIQGRVSFRGGLPQRDLWRWLSESDLLLLPSLREDASFITAEAVTLGIPVVAFDRGGPAVLQRSQGALIRLVPLNSRHDAVSELAAALVSYEAWAAKAVGAVDESFRPPNIARIVSSFYAQVVNQKSTSGQSIG